MGAIRMKDDGKLTYLIELLIAGGFELKIKPYAQHTGFEVAISKNGIKYHGTSGAAYVGVFKAIDCAAKQAIRGSNE
jgi:hypothetical protein